MKPVNSNGVVKRIFPYSVKPFKLYTYTNSSGIQVVSWDIFSQCVFHLTKFPLILYSIYSNYENFIKNITISILRNRIIADFKIYLSTVGDYQCFTVLA